MTSKTIVEALLWPVYTPVSLLVRLVTGKPGDETDNSFQIFIALIISAVIELGLGIWGIVYLGIFCFGS